MPPRSTGRRVQAAIEGNVADKYTNSSRLTVASRGLRPEVKAQIIELMQCPRQTCKAPVGKGCRRPNRGFGTSDLHSARVALALRNPRFKW